MDVSLHLFVDVLHDAVILEARYEVADVQIDDGIFIQVFLELRVAGNLQVCKELARVARLIVVGAQHLGCHRFAETTATRDATETTFRKQRRVNNAYQPRLIDVLAIAGSHKSYVSCINI